MVWLQETVAGFLARVLPNENAATFSSWFVFSLCLRCLRGKSLSSSSFEALENVCGGHMRPEPVQSLNHACVGMRDSVHYQVKMSMVCLAPAGVMLYNPYKR